MARKGSLELCKFMGATFYLDGSEYFDFSSTDTFMPAWMVPQHKVPKRGSTDPKEPTMLCKTKEIDFTFEWRSLGKVESQTVKVTRHYLEINPMYRGSDVKLTRPATPTMVTVAQKKPAPIKQQGADTDTARTVDSEWFESNKLEFHEAKHLYK
eukprot:270444-Pyramimonas_sp.AAC.1